MQIWRRAGRIRRSESAPGRQFWTQPSGPAGKLVLMIENLQALCGNVEERLRVAAPRRASVGAANCPASHPPPVGSKSWRIRGKPFFELFRIVSLGPLATEECRCLWEAMTGDRVGARDIRPLEILTGGNCRLLAIVAGFSEHHSLRRLMEELVRLVDEHTEYFRGHLEVLPKAERRVYVAVLDLWQPSSTSEIAARARMDVRAVSTMLGRLVRRGAVVGRPSTGSRRRRYAAAEPLYSIYYKLRRERDETAVVESLIQFMLAFYDRFALYAIFDRLWSEARDAPALHSGIDRVLQGRPADQDLQSKIRLGQARGGLQEGVGQSACAEADRELDDGIVTAFRGKVLRKSAGTGRPLCGGGVGQSAPRPWQTTRRSYLAHLRADAHFGLGEFEEVIAIGSDVPDRFRESRDIFILYRSARVLCTTVAACHATGRYHESIGYAATAIDWFDGLEASEWQQIIAVVLRFSARAHAKLGDVEAAVATCDEIAKKYGESEDQEIQLAVAEALADKADVVRDQLQDLDEAVAMYDVLIARHGASDDARIRG